MTRVRRQQSAFNVVTPTRHDILKGDPIIGRPPSADLPGDTQQHSHEAIALRDLIEQSLTDGKAQDIVTIDLLGKTTIADFMMVACGGSLRQVNALTERLRVDLKKILRRTPTVEGQETCDWVLIDAGDVVVHLFRPEVRRFYNIEKMWTVDFSAEQVAV